MKPLLTTLFAAASLTLAGAVSAADANPAAVTGEELAALSNEVNLPAWMQLVTSPTFAAGDESWTAVYSPKDAVGEARNWDAQVAQARLLKARPVSASQKIWLAHFIKAGEAIGQKDTNRFVAAIRQLQIGAPAARVASTTNPKFFTAK